MLVGYLAASMRQIIIDFGTLHILGSDIALRIYGYGLMLVLGFMLAIYMARWRARRMGENPDELTYAGLIALVAGVLGARVAYIIEQWHHYSKASFGEILNLTSGGLIYYGGLGLGMVAVIVFLFVRRLPVRRFLDIIAPTLMLGLAFGRLGCLLNGCCWGGLVDDHWAFAAHFPMYSQPVVKVDPTGGPFSRGIDGLSPVFASQLHDPKLRADLHLDQRLLLHPWQGPVHPRLPRDLHGKLAGDQLAILLADDQTQRAAFDAAAGNDGLLTHAQWDKAQADGTGLLRGSESWDEAIFYATSSDAQGRPVLSFANIKRYISDRKDWLCRDFDENQNGQLADDEYQRANEYLQADLYTLASQQHALAVRPAQAMGAINAFLLAALLAVFVRLRTREGQVFALLLIAYPITRFIEELIRADNPHDLARFVLTHNQITSILMAVAGVAVIFTCQKLSPSAGPVWADRLSAAEGKNPCEKLREQEKRSHE